MGRGYSLRPGISGCSLWLSQCHGGSRWHHSPADSAERTSLFCFGFKKNFFRQTHIHTHTQTPHTKTKSLRTLTQKARMHYKEMNALHRMKAPRTEKQKVIEARTTKSAGSRTSRGLATHHPRHLSACWPQTPGSSKSESHVRIRGQGQKHPRIQPRSF